LYTTADAVSNIETLITPLYATPAAKIEYTMGEVGDAINAIYKFVMLAILICVKT
jgi:hypothetical protein